MGWCVQVAVVCHDKPYLTTSFSRTPITIGANPENDLVLDDSIVSAKHAVVLVSRSQLVFRDHSTNGSFYQGQRIDSDTILGVHGEISIPPFKLEFIFEPEKGEATRKTRYHSNLADMVPDSVPVQPPPSSTPAAASEPPVLGTAAAEVEQPSTPRATRPFLPSPATAAAEQPAREISGNQAQARNTEAPDRDGPLSPVLADSGTAVSPEPPAVPMAVDELAASPHFADPAAGTVLSSAIGGGPAPPALLCLVGSTEGVVQQDVPLPARTVRLGRSESADIRFADSTISRLHATISPAGGEAFLVTDLDSSNGTYVNDRRVKQTLLQDGDTVRFGEILFRFHLTDLPTTPQKTPDEPHPPATSPSELDIQIEELAGAAVPIYRVAIRGTVDTHHYTELSDALDGRIDSGARLIVIDLREVDYISPTGLGVLVKCLTRLRKLRGDLRLFGLDQRLRDALSLSRVDALFKGRIADSQEQAIEGWLRG